eukprot:1362320-Amorphochlora_amoeboformis.AAC.1
MYIYITFQKSKGSAPHGTAEPLKRRALGVGLGYVHAASKGASYRAVNGSYASIPGVRVRVSDELELETGLGQVEGEG